MITASERRRGNAKRKKKEKAKGSRERELNSLAPERETLLSHTSGGNREEKKKTSTR